MADKKLRFALLNRFKKRSLEVGKAQDINMFSQQWAADALIESFGYDECLDAIDYYFAINSDPSWSWFSYNMERVLQSKRIEEEDKRIRADLRVGAKKWLEG